MLDLVYVPLEKTTQHLLEQQFSGKLNLELLKAYQREVEDTRKETRERRKSVTSLTEEKKRLERCLKQAVQGREKAMLEVDYLKAELFDQRKKLLNAYLDASKAS